MQYERDNNKLARFLFDVCVISMLSALYAHWIFEIVLVILAGSIFHNNVEAASAAAVLSGLYALWYLTAGFSLNATIHGITYSISKLLSLTGIRGKMSFLYVDFAHATLKCTVVHSMVIDDRLLFTIALFSFAMLNIFDINLGLWTCLFHHQHIFFSSNQTRF